MRSVPGKVAWIVLCVAAVVVAGCTASSDDHTGGVLPNNGEALPENSGDAIPESGGFDLVAVELTECRVYSEGGGEIVDQRMIDLQGTYTVLRDDFAVRFYFTELFDRDDFINCLEVEPDTDFVVEEIFSYDKDWGGKTGQHSIQLRFSPIPVGAKVRVGLQGLRSASGSKMEEIADLTFIKAEEPRIAALECLNFPHKPAQLIRADVPLYYLPPGELDFRVTFSKPMRRDAVESLLLERLGGKSAVSCTWKSDRELLLIIHAVQTGINYNLDLNGGLDMDGYSLATQPVFVFRTVGPTKVYARNVVTGREIELDVPHAYFDTAVISPEGKEILYREPMSYFEYTYTTDVLFTVGEQKVRLLEKDERSVPLHISPVVWSADSRYLVVGSRLYNREGKLLHAFDRTVFGAAFAPGGDRLAVLVRGDDGIGLPVLDCLVYDLEQMKTATKFAGVTLVLMGEALFYRVIDACWRGDCLLFEDSEYMENVRRPALASLDLENRAKKELAADLGDLHFSPGGEWVVANYYAEGKAIGRQGAVASLYDTGSGVRTVLVTLPSMVSSGRAAAAELSSPARAAHTSLRAEPGNCRPSKSTAGLPGGWMKRLCLFSDSVSRY